MQDVNVKKQFIEEEQLLEEAFKLAVTIYDSGFRPDFIVGIWRGGSTVGIYVRSVCSIWALKPTTSQSELHIAASRVTASS